MSTSEQRSVELRIRVRPSEAEALRKLAEQDRETTISALVRKAISRYIEQELGS
jgi:hypothetical protein